MIDPNLFKDRDFAKVCDMINKDCEININNVYSDASAKARSFYNELPKLLVYIFGGPTERGLMQTETFQTQNTAIKRLLSVESQFFRALVKLSAHPEYSYDLVTTALPREQDDIRRILASGAIDLLPPVYANCSHLATSSDINTIDIRTAATTQASLLPTSSGGGRKIRFNMLQFYLYYFTSVATWPMLPPQSAHFTLPTHTTSSHTSKSLTTPASKANNAIPGKQRPLRSSPYGEVLEEYMKQLIPVNANTGYSSAVKFFFVDACIELWIRTIWISKGTTKTHDFMECLKLFLGYIVSQDLKHCQHDEKTMIADMYRRIKGELCTLISRLAINWRKEDSFMHVIDVWCIWAAPWKMGRPVQSSSPERYDPFHTGWGDFVMDNLPFYFTIMDLLLQHTGTFQFREETKTHGFQEGGTFKQELRMISRLINVLSASGLVDFLGTVESAFLKLQNPKDIIFKEISQKLGGSDEMVIKVHQKLTTVRKLLAELEGVKEEWKPSGLYAKDIRPRSDSLVKTLLALNKAIVNAEASKDERSRKRAFTFRDLYQQTVSVSRVVGDEHLHTQTMPPKTPAPNTQPTTKTEWIGPTYVGKGGFLTEGEKQLLFEGMAICTQDNIPALGERAIRFVRSYENRHLVEFTLKADKVINRWYDTYLPIEKRPAFLYRELTLRPFARRVNFVYAVGTLFLMLYLFLRWLF